MPQQPFRLSMLLYDTRYRSLTIQVVAVLAFMLAAAWLVNNTVQNLDTLGKDFSFGFLGARAGYDISQTLIPYTNDSTHARAALVGIVNTLLVAFVGCILATVIGVFMGVLRLSNNWIVARLAAVYVDGFRNIPVLLWILATLAIITDIAPAPAAFRGENATASMLFGSIAVTNRGLYIPWPVLGPGWHVVVGTFIASLIAIMVFGRWASAPPGGDGRDPAHLLDQARPVPGPGPAGEPGDGRPDHPRLSRCCSASTSRAAASSTSRSSP